MLCPRCNEFLRELVKFQVQRYIVNGVSLDDLLHDSKHREDLPVLGCVLCDRIRYIMRTIIEETKEDGSDKPDHDSYTIWATFSRSGNRVQFVYLWPGLAQGVLWHDNTIVMSCQRYLTPKAIVPVIKNQWQHLTKTLLSSLSPSKVQLTKVFEWIKECDSSHKHCNRLRKHTSWWPRRLLDVRTLARQGMVILVDTQSLRTIEPYVTLSHRWGRRVPYKLTGNTQHTLRNGVRDKDLEQILSDSIELVRKLGVGYLWADTLCIFQDSAVDWNTEAADMGKVYENSYLNIAASSAMNGACGLLPDWSFPLRKRRNGTLWFRENTRWSVRLKFMDADLFKTGFGLEPLHRRAWAIQELVLTRRVLFFTSNEVQWRCMTCAESDIRGQVYDSFSLNTFRLNYDSVRDIDLHWTKLVDLFSRCQLTFETDKLNALAGLAERFSAGYRAQGLDTTYVAGHWTHNLLQSLPFTAKPLMGSGLVPAEYLAPSWSWAAFSQEIFLFSLGDEEFWGRILEVETVPAKVENPLGRLESGYLSCHVPARYVCKPARHPAFHNFITATPFDDDRLAPKCGFVAYLDHDFYLEMYNEWLLVFLGRDLGICRGLILRKLEDKNANAEDRFVRIGTWRELDLFRADASRAGLSIAELPSPYDLFRVDDPSTWMDITIV